MLVEVKPGKEKVSWSFWTWLPQLKKKKKKNICKDSLLKVKLSSN